MDTPRLGVGGSASTKRLISSTMEQIKMGLLTPIQLVLPLNTMP